MNTDYSWEVLAAKDTLVRMYGNTLVAWSALSWFDTVNELVIKIKNDPKLTQEKLGYE